MFSVIPDIYLKTPKEIKKIFTLFYDSNINILNEINVLMPTIRHSYNALLITSDNRLILCSRKFSFYASYVIYSLTKKKKYFNEKKFLNCVKNLNIKEFSAFYYMLDRNKIINLKKHVSPEIYEYMSNFVLDEEYNKFFDISYSFISNDNIIINKLVNILLDFVNNILLISNTKNVILPGGKSKSIDEKPLDILKRELFEELNLSITDVEYLNKYYKFIAIDENIYPVLCMYIHDKVLKYNYLDLTYILRTKKTFQEINLNFKANNEVHKLISTTKIHFDTTNLRLNNIIYLLKIYKKYIYS